MTMDALRTQISDVITAEGCASEFYFLLGQDEGMSVKRVAIDEKDQDGLASIFIQHISESILLNDDLSLIPLSSADDRTNAIYEYDLGDVPEQLTHLKEIIESDEFDNFSFQDSQLSAIKGILVLIGNQDVQLALYKHQYPVSLLRKDGTAWNLIKSGNGDRFKKLDQDVLKVNQNFEFLKIKGRYYIVDIKALEKFFGFHEAVKNVAKRGIANIEDANIVLDIAVLKNRLDDISFSRKLVKSASNSPVLGVIPNQDVISFTDTHPALQGRFKYSEDGSKLDLATKKSQNLFLKLLNDDYLQSELTKRYYDSIAKDNVHEHNNIHRS